MSESGFVDDGGLIVTRNYAFAHTIGPKKIDIHTPDVYATKCS